ncbi:MAG: sulfatase-like hydrolase/transferase [Dysgonamonadaceae bacterium]|jgi:heptose-I-phosphate ethanolaminephosphotransferase|nr:sulfatase-like hydrolase/transferase [Dysgonamonadaceae bacterium]
MKLQTNLLKTHTPAFILIFFILFFIPVFYFWADDISLKDKQMGLLTCLIVGLALSVIDLFLQKRVEKIYLTVLFLLSLAPNLIVWSYLYISNIYMKRDMYWVIFNSHYSESREYFEQFIPWQIIIVAGIYIAIGIFLIAKAHTQQSLSIKQRPFLFAVPVLLVITSISFQYLSQTIPTFEFYKSYFLFLQEHRNFLQEQANRDRIKAEVRSALSDSIRHVFVIAIGESETICHMSIYGYPRATTPYMDSLRSELDVYTDVVTPDTHTYGALQKVLTFASHQHPEYYASKPSIMDLFNAAGYETYWISTQPLLDKWGASYGVIAAQADHTYDLSVVKQHDEIVIPTLHKILTDSIQRDKVVFIHLLGNHHSYKSRYPGSFDHFNAKRDNDVEDLGFREDHMKKTIDEYDNSVLYGDYVWYSILSELKLLNCSSYFLFFSDHGEEIYETRNVSGHLMENVYPCQAQIPFILWRSEHYKAEIPGLVIDPSRSYNTEDAIYSISTLSGLEYKDYNPSLSLFSEEYKEPQRRIVGKEDYEMILRKVLR